jgi:transposase
MDIREVLYQLRAGESERAISRQTGLHRKTVRQYHEWAKREGLLSETLPDVEQLEGYIQAQFGKLEAPLQVSSVEPYRAQVEQLTAQGVDGTVIWRRLQERGYTGSLSSIYRFLNRQKQQSGPEVVVRVEREPGEESQVDFGYAGELLDERSGKMRKAWAFVMTLAWSRHMYVEFVFDQRVETWLECHRRAFEYFGGIPQRVVLDNLKAAIVRATQDDPQVQRAYRECAEHYGFIIAPCRPRTPQHKGKVERGVQYVKRSFLAGRELSSLHQANGAVKDWCLQTAGQRVHGTTKQIPLVCFEQTERAVLRPLPAQSYDRAVWKTVKLHRDCYLVFDGAFYSAPFRLVGQTLLVRAGTRDVRIYTQDQQLIATHDRAAQPGERLTHPAHLPPEKLPGLLFDAATAQAAANDIGDATGQIVQLLLEDTVLDHRDQIRRLLALRDGAGDQRLEAACQRALYFGDPSLVTVKRILDKQLDQQAVAPSEPTVAPARTFARTAAELLGNLFGALTWQ